jgi:hypothetical protein
MADSLVPLKQTALSEISAVCFHGTCTNKKRTDELLFFNIVGMSFNVRIGSLVTIPLLNLFCMKAQ